MLKKINNKQLLVALVLLIIIVVVVMYSDDQKGEKTFKTELVNIDSASVTSFSIFFGSKKEDEMRLLKQQESWKVQLKNNKLVPASQQMIASLFHQVSTIKPTRLAGQDESTWKDFKVDTGGTRLKVMQGDKATADIIIGKFNYSQTKQSHETFIRLVNEKEVYAMDGFFNLTFNKDIAGWREQSVIDGKPEDWTKLNFTYPSDSSYQLTKENNKWKIAGMEVDSQKVKNYLQTLSHTRNPDFLDDINPAQLSAPTFTLAIETKDNKKLEVKAHPHPTYQYVISSSQNPESFFGMKKGNLIESIFAGKSKFSVADTTSKKN